jgi:hypothetical protein
MRVERLNDGPASEHEADFLADRKGGLQAVILDADLAALGWDAVPGALDFAQPPPAVGLDGPAITFAHQAVPSRKENPAPAKPQKRWRFARSKEDRVFSKDHKQSAWLV